MWVRYEIRYVMLEIELTTDADDFRTECLQAYRQSAVLQEENDIGEFFMSLDKDPQQEDFLQGRMLGNPYSSNVPALGPLMRDVKNKICQGESCF